VRIFPVLRNAAAAGSPRLDTSIYGAVQQLILAAGAHGAGTTLTTLYSGHEDGVRDLLGLPRDALTMGLDCWATRPGAAGPSRNAARRKGSCTGTRGEPPGPGPGPYPSSLAGRNNWSR
jgi:hypothetical protein